MTAIAVRDQVAGLKTKLAQVQTQIARALPAGVMTPARFEQAIITLCAQNPALLQCNGASLIGAVLRAAHLGLDPDPALGQSWFVPFKQVVQFIPGYKGLANLAWRTSQIAALGMQVVRDGDDFDFAYGTESFLKHRPRSKPNAQVLYAYALAKPIGGDSMFEVMTTEEIESVKARSPSARSGKSPWITDWEAMARKTAFRRLSKLLPLSGEKAYPLLKAVDLDERAELGLKQRNAEDMLEIDDDEERQLADAAADAERKANEEDNK